MSEWMVQNIAQPGDLATMGQQIAWLIENAYAFNIEANDERGVYQTVESFVEVEQHMHGTGFSESWASEEDMQACVEANFMICVRCYPSTSVGFYCGYGSSVAEVVSRIYAAVRADLEARPNVWRAQQDSNLQPLA